MLLTPSEIKYIQDFQAFTKNILARAQRAGKCRDFAEGFFVRLDDLLSKFQQESWRSAGKFCRHVCRRAPLIPHCTLYANLKQMSSTYLVSYN